jgi:hypothetical protein
LQANRRFVTQHHSFTDIFHPVLHESCSPIRRSVSADPFPPIRRFRFPSTAQCFDQSIIDLAGHRQTLI